MKEITIMVIGKRYRKSLAKVYKHMHTGSCKMIYMEPMLHIYSINLLAIKSWLFMSIFLSLSLSLSLLIQPIKMIKLVALRGGGFP